MLEVRAARHGDAPALDALGAAPEAGVFVLEKNGAVIGALTLRAGEIFGCAVAPEWRGRGYGTFLLRRALRAAGPGPVYTQTPPGNAAMEALLRRCGFRPQEQALPAAGEEPARAREAGAAAGPLSLPQKWVRGAPDGDGENALAVAHAFLRTHVRPGAFALDATAGNGHDTLFLCRLVGAAGRVLAFDVQPQAVENTNARLRENGCGQVGRAVLDSHANLAAYAAPGSVDAAVFNLGYLPGGDHGVFTTPGVSVPAMRTALELLRPGGVMTVCVYYGGPQGMAEKDAVRVSHGSAAGRIPRVCARFFRPAGLSAHPRLHRKAGLVNGRRVPCDAAAFLCRAPMVSPFFHTRMIVLSHPWPILKATSGKKEDVDL